MGDKNSLVGKGSQDKAVAAVEGFAGGGNHGKIGSGKRRGRRRLLPHGRRSWRMRSLPAANGEGERETVEFAGARNLEVDCLKGNILVRSILVKDCQSKPAICNQHCCQHIMLHGTACLCRWSLASRWVRRTSSASTSFTSYMAYVC